MLLILTCILELNNDSISWTKIITSECHCEEVIWNEVVNYDNNYSTAALPCTEYLDPIK